MTKSSAYGILIYVVATLLGLTAFLYPFLDPVRQPGGIAASRSLDSPLILSLLVAICLLALVFEMQSQGVNTKFVALLGILVAINSVLRFAEVAIPGPAGFSPIFFLITLAGYIFGSRFGFLMGAFSLLVSALITGGVGPWLPFEMLAAGWVGMTAPICRAPVAWLRGEGRWSEIAMLAAFGGIWGLLYGAVMNISFWPYASGPADEYWQAGLRVGEGLRRYVAFYLATSLLWDAARLAGNLVFMSAFGGPALRVLRRFRERFSFTYHPSADVQVHGSISEA